jgi:hypothetical protein
MPAIFDAYARILHPARTSRGQQVPWAAVAEQAAGRMHRLVQFDSLVGASRYGPQREVEPGSIDRSRSAAGTIDGPRVSIPDRDYILLEGALGAATGFDDEPPSIFWPDDRAWCVATEIDLDSTYVGGSQALIPALFDDPRFEAWPAEPDDRVDAGADTINPTPSA